jgi:hypothetical protein
MAAAYEQIKEDITSIGNKLKPIAGLFLIIVDGILKMVNGILGEIIHGFKGVGIYWKGIFGPLGLKGLNAHNNREYETWAEERKARNRSFLKTIGRFLSFGIYTGHEPVGPSLSDEAKRESEGAAEGLITIAASKGLNKLAEYKNLSTEFRAPGSTEWVRKPMGPESPLMRESRRMVKAFMVAQSADVGRKDIADHILSERGDRLPAPNRSGFLQGMGMGYGAGGGGNLAIGGVFGVDIQTKIIDLNVKIAKNTETMAELLQLIVENTAPGDYGIGSGGEEGASGY